MTQQPKALQSILQKADELHFTMSCDMATGQLLRSLAASKRQGALLELGTGAGVSTCWILDGMDEDSSLISVEMDKDVQDIAKSHIHDRRVNFVTMDGGQYIQENKTKTFDFIFADTWPGKYYLLTETLAMVKSGGFYIIDDLTPVGTWPADHREKAKKLVETLTSLDGFHLVELNWSTGLVIATRK